MASILENLDSLTPSEVKGKQEESLEWFRQNLRKTRLSPRQLAQEGEPLKTPLPLIGSMIMFNYDAKWQDVLPYWDKFPVVIPFDFSKGGFIGLNLHYIAPRYRTLLLMGLLEYAYDVDGGEDDDTRLRLTYQLLQSSAELKWYKPCVKRYLTSHIKGTIRTIPYDNWDVIAMLPTQRFEGANANTVYAESRRKVI